ncbi:MAG: 4-hydroxy-3-methylbut-2-enyl diphosphate reductase [Oscillospiraceae bacterium]|nr:4-hydroxy-3-methylbut-2-enyl diphosphate reductase [Oscillospiraceae bacterium]
MFKITVAESAGFCAGVKRAFDIAVAAAEKHSKAYTLGKLAHNNDVVRLLEEHNVFVGSGTPTIITAHGVGKDVYVRLTDYVDATCPFVKRIHEIVDNKTFVIIVGDEKHPEVIGIKGHTSGECYVVNSAGALENLLCENEKFRQNAQFLVSQTTFNKKKWQDCVEILKKHCTNVQIFDTICNATVKRQEEAEQLSKQSDIMIVIGSSESSNSVKLYEICQEYCENAFFVENAANPLLKRCLAGFKSAKIGITAGASVPGEIIKEVHSLMNEEIKKNVNEAEGEFDFMEEVNKTFQKIYTGKRVKAYVVAVNKTEAVVDLGTKHSGYIPADEIGGEPGTTPEDTVKPGDEIECIVTSVSDIEGIVYLSKKRVDADRGYEKLTTAYSESAVLEGYVSSVVNGGVIITFEGSRVFIPASQSGVPKTGKLEELLKKTKKFKVIEINEQKSRVVGSIKAASRLENDAVRAKFWEEIEIGKKFVGEIKSIENYGVFVDLGGVDGMVHLSELTWKRVKHPKEIVSIGDKLEVYVKSFDPEKKRVSLCAKNPNENPWTKFTDEFGVGDTVKATVVNITPFGAFAQIMPGIDGLVHISQISLERVKNVNQALQIGEEIEAQITEIDAEKERVSISIKALLEPAEVSQEEVSQGEVIDAASEALDEEEE